MKKLLIFSRNKNMYLNKNIITGGQMYDYKLISYINRNFHDDIIFEDEQTYGITGNKLIKIYGYIKNAKNLARYDYIIVNSTNFRFAFIIKKIHRCNPKTKIIFIHHHFEYLSQGYISPKRILLKSIEKYMLKKSDLIIIPNQYPYNIAINEMNIDRNKICKIENSFDKNKIYKLTTYNQGELLYVGTIEHRKGIHILIQALAEIKDLDYHMHCVGKYDENSRYYKKIIKQINKKNIKDKITFHGRVSNDELDKLYKESSTFIFPSLNEGYGLVILEAMAHGLPVVAFNNTAMPFTIVNGENGFLVKNKDYKELAKKIKMVLNNNTLVRQMGRNAILTFNEAKSNEEIGHKIKEFIDNVLI